MHRVHMDAMALTASFATLLRPFVNIQYHRFVYESYLIFRSSTVRTRDAFTKDDKEFYRTQAPLGMHGTGILDRSEFPIHCYC